MPPLVCLGPQLLDHSFPRSDIELYEVADALAEIDELRETHELCLALPGTLALFTEEFCWDRPTQQKQLLDVHRYLAALFAHPSEGVERIDVDCVEDWVLHPVPAGCEREGLIAMWSEEVGRLIRRHDSSVSDGGYCIGIFVGTSEAVRAGYDCESEVDRQARQFPLVDARGLTNLEDAYVWKIPADYARRTVKPRDVIANFRAIGAVELREPEGDDHYHVVFPPRGGQDKAKWQFAQNWSQLRDMHIAQLRRLTGLPAAAVKYGLLEGKDPREQFVPILRLELCSGCDPCPHGRKSP